MILRKLFLVIFVVLSAICYSQEKAIEDEQVIEEYTFRTKVYGKKEGYPIKIFRASIVDDYGTLWVAGDIDNPEVIQFNKEYVGLYFFNGTKFQEFPLHDSLRGHSIKLLPGINKDFIVLLKNEIGPILLSINPFDLSSREIEQPKFSNEGLQSIKHYVINNQLHLVYTFEKKSVIYKYNENDKFELINEVVIKSKDIAYFETVIPFKNSVLLNDINSGIYTLNEDFTKLTAENLGLNLDKNRKILIIDHFEYRDSIFLKFNISRNYYYYNETTRNWEITNSNRFPFNNKEDKQLFSTQSKSLIFSSKKVDRTYLIEIYSKEKEELLTTIPLGEYMSNPKVNSRDNQKELFIFSRDKITQITYSRLKVKTFLKKNSIRAMHELPDNIVLVGTEHNGMKEIDLETGSEKDYYGYLFGDLFSPEPARGIFQDSNGIFTNYGSGFCFIDNKSKKVTNYRYFPISVFKNKGDNLYYGTNGYKLMRFDKKSRTNIPVANTEGINMQDLLINGDTIYSATLSGLFVYCNGKQELIKPTQGSEQFLCLTLHPKLGILLGTIDGKVLVYNASKREFKELYSDELKSSVATILVDDNDNIWINTFKGFIQYNFKDKSTLKYGVQDGFTNNEANRLAALKLKNGNLLIGTVKGLNYFNPTELSETEIDATLRVTAIKYVDSDKRQKNVISRKELVEIQSITLQPQNRNITISFGFKDILGLQEELKFKYRLNKGEWRIESEFGELFLGNLAPDKYELEIIAINQIETEIGTPIKMTIIAQQFFYKTGWFWVIIGFIVLVIISWIAYQFYRNQKLKQHFSDKIINAHIEEQASLSQKLHDSVGQKLLLAKNDLILNKKMSIEELSNIDEIISEVRNISHDLHPLQFETLGFKTSVENLVEDFQRNSSIFFSHDINCKDSILSLEKEIILFGVIQESLNNVEKHSRAEACQVLISEKGKNLRIQIKDNGKGFDINKKSTNFSLGLKTMKEKADYLNANLTFLSNKNEGTRIRLNVKLNNE